MRARPNQNLDFGLLHFWENHHAPKNVHFATSRSGETCGRLISPVGHRYKRNACQTHSRHHCECVWHARLRRSSFARKTGWGRKFSAKSHSGHCRQRARPRSLRTSYRTLQATQPSSPAHPTTHTSSSARDSPGTPSLMLPVVESLGSTCPLMGKPSTAEFLQPEHRNHRSVPPTDSPQLGACRIKPCAKR